MNKRNMHIIAKIDSDVEIKGMTVYQGELYLATASGVYVMGPGGFKPVPLGEAPGNEETQP